MMAHIPSDQPQRPTVPYLVAELYGEIDDLILIFLDGEIECWLDDARELGYMDACDDGDEPLELGL